MNLHDYLASDGAMSVAELAKAINVPGEQQIRQWRHGYSGRRPSPENCVAIEQATGGAVTRQELRLDDWRRIWPELVKAGEAV